MTVDTEVVAYRRVVQRTYRYLRLGMVLLVVLLAVAVAMERWRHGSLLDSISAYYYTPVHSVFVACLCAVGACLIIYRGRTDLEDVTLNAAGFLAFVVAFVPTGRGEADCDPQRAFCDIPTSTIEANVEALLFVGILGLALSFLVSIRPTRGDNVAQRVDKPARVAYYILAAGYASILITYFLARDTFLRFGHYAAAIALFVAMVFVVILSGARQFKPPEDGAVRRRTVLRIWYWGSFLFMLLTMGAIVILHWRGQLDPWIFFLEFSGITGFAVFWLTQTAFEVWDEPAEGGSTSVEADVPIPADTSGRG
jgi:hypothetical protein